MTQLFLNDKQVFLPEKFSISIVERNPMFYESGSYSKPFVIPYEPNAHLINFPARIERKGENPQFDFRLVHEGIQILSGSAHGDGDMPDPEKFPLVLLSGKSEFLFGIKNKKLSEIDLGSFNFPFPIHDVCEDSIDIDNSNGNNIPFVCAPVIRRDDEDNITWLNKPEQETLTKYLDDSNPQGGYAFHMRTGYLLYELLTAQGYVIDHSEIERFNETLLFTNIAHLGSANYNELNKHVPVCDARAFVDAVLGYEGARVFYDTETDSISIRRLQTVIESNQITDINNIIQLVPEIRFFTDGHRLSIEGIDGDSNSNTEKFIIQGSVANWDALPGLFDSALPYIYYVEDREKYVQRVQINDSPITYQWHELGAARPSVAGNEEEEISLNFKTLKQSYVDYEFLVTGNWEPIVYDSCEYDGEFTDYTNVNNPYVVSDIIFITMAHIDYTYGRENYPTSMNGRYRFFGQETDRNDIRPTGQHGIYALRYKKYIDWLNRRKPFYAYAKMSISDLRKIKMYKKYRFGRIAGIIDTIEYTITQNGIGTVKIKCWTV